MSNAHPPGEPGLKDAESARTRKVPIPSTRPERYVGFLGADPGCPTEGQNGKGDRDGYGINGAGGEGMGYFGMPPNNPPRKEPFYRKRIAGGKRIRVNITPIAVCMFVPWILFDFIAAMMSFAMHHSAAAACFIIFIVLVVVFGILLAHSLVNIYRTWAKSMTTGTESGAGPNWYFVMLALCLLAVVLAVALGDRNYWINMQPYYDALDMDTYKGVDVVRTRGTELMDAGRVTFTPPTRLDLKRAMGFKNQDTYCVVPITSAINGVTVGLKVYDFWAVGKNCCSAGNADFHCNDYSHPGVHGGMRVMRDEDRDFYRLAVQQAESVYQIKASHPLFFHWVQDPDVSVYEKRRDGFKYYFIMILGHFAFQLVMVAAAVYFFHFF